MYVLSVSLVGAVKVGDESAAVGRAAGLFDAVAHDAVRRLSATARTGGAVSSVQHPLPHRRRLVQQPAPRLLGRFLPAVPALLARRLRRR